MITPVAAPDLPGVYFRYAAIPTSVATLAALAIGAAVAGLAGLWAGLLGGLVVVGFFGLDLLIMRLSVEWSPVATFGAVIAEYLAKLIALAVLLAAVRASTTVDAAVMGVTIGVTAVVFLSGLVVAHLRVKTFSIDPVSSGSDLT